MKDRNGNGLPDDTWYEIAGSRYRSRDHIPYYEVTYFNPGQDGSDVLWIDNLGDSGFVRHNEFHSQAYYPEQTYFPGLSADSLRFSGSRLLVPVRSENGIVKTRTFLFGYADNRSRVNTGMEAGPDNPYTPIKRKEREEMPLISPGQ